MKTSIKMSCLLSLLITSAVPAATLKLTVNLKGIAASEFKAPRVHFTSQNPLCKVPGMMMPGLQDREEDFYAAAPVTTGTSTLEYSIPLTYPKGNFCNWKVYYVVLESSKVGSTFAFYSDLKPHRKPTSPAFDLISNSSARFGSECKPAPKTIETSYGYDCKDFVQGIGEGEVHLKLKGVKLPTVLNREFDITFR